MGGRAKLAALKHDKDECTDDRDKVQGEVYEVADDGLGREPCKRLAHELAQLSDGIASWLDLALFGHEGGLVSADQGAVESVDEGIVDEKVLAEDREDGGRLAENEQHGGEDGEWTIKYRKNCGLGDVEQREHHGCHPKTERRGWYELGRERLP